MTIRKIGRKNYNIKYPTLDKYYNSLYSQTYNKIYYGCPKHCKTCKLWNKPNQIWKIFHFFPIHCHFCGFAGNEDEFMLENIFVLCKNCKLEIKEKKKQFIRNKFLT